MPLADLLRPEHVYLDPPWTTFEEAVAGMVAGVARAGSIDPATCEPATEALLARERASSTAIPEIGLAIPHARLAGLRVPVAALAVAARGLYEAAPSLPIRIVALVLSPQQATEAHLQLLAGVATGLRSPALRTALLRASTPAEVLAALDATA
jgi:mannitol/fructose-specific phosphotransferase system IIA component (Ntr-type)